MAIELPFPDPLGLLEAETRATGAPVVFRDPLFEAFLRQRTHWMDARHQAIQSYAEALLRQPLDPRARMKAIDNYARSLMRLDR